MQLQKFLEFIFLILHFKATQQHSCNKTINAFCVPYYLCKQEQPFNETVIIDFMRPSHVNCNYLEVCCPKYLITDSNDLDLKNQIDSKINQTYPKNKRKCGVRNKNGLFFKIYGAKSETQFGEFPWMIAILKGVIGLDYYNFNNSIQYIKCEGSLIHPSVILTVAHCVMDEKNNNLFARAGEWDTEIKDEILQYEDRKIVEVLLHNQFDRTLLYFDIALLFLETPNLNPLGHINTVCLAPPQMNFIHKNCFQTGWGEAVTILKKATLSIKSSQNCEEQLKGPTLKNYFKLHETFLCAMGANNTHTCLGHGGSPLSCPIDDEEDHYYQSGIVAWGIGCEVTDPGVYVNIPYLRSWIDYVFATRRLDHSYYTK